MNFYGLRLNLNKIFVFVEIGFFNNTKHIGVHRTLVVYIELQLIYRSIHICLCEMFIKPNVQCENNNGNNK